jgi:hypothetical protein
LGAGRVLPERQVDGERAGEHQRGVERGRHLSAPSR